MKIYALVENESFVPNKKIPSHPIIKKKWKWITKDDLCYPAGVYESLENDSDSTALTQDLEPNSR